MMTPEFLKYSLMIFSNFYYVHTFLLMLDFEIKKSNDFENLLQSALSLSVTSA